MLSQEASGNEPIYIGSLHGVVRCADCRSLQLPRLAIHRPGVLRHRATLKAFPGACMVVIAIERLLLAAAQQGRHRVTGTSGTHGHPHRASRHRCTRKMQPRRVRKRLTRWGVAGSLGSHQLRAKRERRSLRRAPAARPAFLQHVCRDAQHGLGLARPGRGGTNQQKTKAGRRRRLTAHTQMQRIWPPRAARARRDWGTVVEEKVLLLTRGLGRVPQQPEHTRCQLHQSEHQFTPTRRSTLRSQTC